MESTVARLQRRNLEKPDEVRSFPNGRLEIFEMDDIVVGRTVFEPGWRWSEAVRPIAGTDRCEYHHLGYCISGRLRVEMSDGLGLEIGPRELFEIPSGHDAWVVGDEPWVTVDFAGMRSFGRATMSSGDRIVATLLFTDIVDSTATAERLGDRAWREKLAEHNELIRIELDRFRGREIDTTGDGFLAVFDGAERAVVAARSMSAALGRTGLVIRSGIHTGEIEFVPGNVRGLAVHVAARIVSLARPGEVLVSWTTRDLMTGTTLEFEDRGLHELKGLTEPRALYAVIG
jgi:class 3 adenylate cyclase